MADIQKVRALADYQFGRGAGFALFPENVDFVYSKTTGRIRHIYLDKKMLATLRPTDGLLALTLDGARRLLTAFKKPRLRVVVQDDVIDLIAAGGSVFSKHVMEADPEIRPNEEVIVTNRMGEVLAVGRALLTGLEMLAFKRGVAVKVRRSIMEG
ncbi:pseudouridine synthase [Candidatus Bathyarchaeota archaeon]|nr:pseudouridine synthase [Candidatus Bathyarchaeota archaeon]